jgi:glycosyltransferase involved in cell wall biosynthesis
MIIAITSNTSWYLYNFRRNTIAYLLNKGYSVLAIAPRDSYSVKLEQIGCRYVHVPIDQAGTNPVRDIKTFLAFLKIYYKYNPDIILNFTPKNNIYSTLAGWLRKVPCINNVAGLGFLFINDNFSTKVARLLYKISQPKAYKIFFQNNDDRQLFIQNKLAPAHLTDRVPGSGVDLNRFNVLHLNNDGIIRFILIARMLYDKGVKEYVDAARLIKARHKNVEFRLLGFLDVNNPSAISKDVMDEWVDEGVIVYLGTTDNVENELSKVDCVVLPTYYREGMPKSLLEAGAMGKPLITTDTSGCRDVVEDGVNGFLCKPRDVNDLVLQLDKIIMMPFEDRLKMGHRSRLKIEREFDEQLVIQKYMQAIQGIQL